MAPSLTPPLNQKDQDKPLVTQKKSKARMAAVKSLYSMEINNWKKSPEEAIKDIDLYYQSDKEKTDTIKYNSKFLKKILVQTFNNKDEIDEIIICNLSTNWTYDRISIVLRCILRLAIFELKYIPKTPAKVVIDEYTNITKAFFDNEETGFTNGILDKISKSLANSETSNEDEGKTNNI